MTGASIRIEADDAAVNAALGRLAAEADDLTEVMAEIGAQLVTNVLLRFEGSAGPGKVPWKPSRRAVKDGGKTLVDTARLQQSVTFAAETHAVEVGTNVEYAAIHQFGGTITLPPYSRLKVRFKHNEKGQLRFASRKDKGKGVTERHVTYGERIIHMPARPFLGIDEADRDDIAAIAASHLQAILGGGVAA